MRLLVAYKNEYSGGIGVCGVGGGWGGGGGSEGAHLFCFFPKKPFLVYNVFYNKTAIDWISYPGKQSYIAFSKNF